MPCIMELLSSEYGWTPQQIREQKNSDIVDYIDIIKQKRKIQNKNSKYGK